MTSKKLICLYVPRVIKYFTKFEPNKLNGSWDTVIFMFCRKWPWPLVQVTFWMVMKSQRTALILCLKFEKNLSNRSGSSLSSIIWTCTHRHTSPFPVYHNYPIPLWNGTKKERVCFEDLSSASLTEAGYNSLYHRINWVSQPLAIRIEFNITIKGGSYKKFEPNIDHGTFSADTNTISTYTCTMNTKLT